MDANFFKGFEKTAFISNVTKLLRVGGKSLLRKAKNVGRKAPPSSLGGVALTGGFIGMEAQGVSGKVKGHMSPVGASMKPADFSQRVKV